MMFHLRWTTHSRCVHRIFPNASFQLSSQVTRMLTGGLSVIGVYWGVPQAVDTGAVTKALLVGLARASTQSV